MHLLSAHVADLELEVDRLRKQCQFMHHEVRDMLRRDLQEPSGYHPAHDQVIAIAVRPLVQPTDQARLRPRARISPRVARLIL